MIRFQVEADDKGQPKLTELTVAGVSYEPVGEVEGLPEDAMVHGGMRDLASVSQHEKKRRLQRKTL